MRDENLCGAQCPRVWECCSQCSVEFRAGWLPRPWWILQCTKLGRWLQCLGRKRVRECQCELCPFLGNTREACLERVWVQQSFCPRKVPSTSPNDSADGHWQPQRQLPIPENDSQSLGLLSDHPFLDAVSHPSAAVSAVVDPAAPAVSHLPRVSARQLIVSLPLELSRHSDVLSNAPT